MRIFPGLLVLLIMTTRTVIVNRYESDFSTATRVHG
jgi:hypothetical protein